jgi:hypothetical protein
MSSRRYYLPGAITRSRGLSAAGGGSVATIASATVSRIAAHAVMTAMTNLRNIWSSPPCTVGVRERMLCQPRRPRHIRQVTDTGRGQRTALTCCSLLYKTQVTQKLILRVPVISRTPAGPATFVRYTLTEPDEVPGLQGAKAVGSW